MSYSGAQIAAAKIAAAKIAGIKVASARIASARLAAIGIICFWSVYALAGHVKIIANRSIKADSISADKLRIVFLAEQNTLKDGSHAEPVFERTGATHEAFLRDFLRESNESLQNHYGALVFTGKALMPKSFNDDAEVLEYVAKTRGAIGYVDASASSEGVKVLFVIPEAGRSARVLLTRIEPEYPETLRQARIGGTVR